MKQRREKDMRSGKEGNKKAMEEAGDGNSKIERSRRRRW